jgi:hypothetical protein
MTTERFAKFENDLRTAVIHKRYADVGRLGELFCAAAETLAKSYAAGDPARARLGQHVDETLEWARLMLYTARAATSDEIRRLPFMSRYVGSPEAPRPNVHLDA